MAESISEAMYTPKQVALALGVSESSVKRWCDSGRMQAARTAGGHRKLPMSAIVAHVRETGQAIANPAAIGMVAVSTRRKPDAVQGELYDTLLAGDEQACRQLLLGLYQQGASVVAIGDDLVGPVFRRIGDGWERGEVSVHEERRSCEVAMAVLHELRRWIPTPPDGGPLALTATPERDFSEVPIRLVELLLQTRGWRTVMAGSGLPIEEIRAAVELRRPRLVCLSITHLEETAAYIDRHNEVLFAEPLGVPVVVGGGALDCDEAREIRCDYFAPRLGDFAQWLERVFGAEGPA